MKFNLTITKLYSQFQMKTKTELIAEIIENFDWDKVHKTMEFLNWKWWDTEGESPSREKLITHAFKLLDQVYDLILEYKETCHVATGGFRATAYYDESDSIGLRLVFELCSWDSYN